MNRRDFSTALIGAGCGTAAFSLPSLAAAQSSSQAAAPTEGKQFTRIEPSVPTVAPPKKIEVLEFFSYACPHCSAFEPTVGEWTKKLPADVSFQRVPVPFLMNAENFMRIYYALDTMGQVPNMQRKVFNAVHVDRQYLERPADIAALMTKNGIDGTKFIEVFNSFSVATSVTRAKKLVAAYKMDSVPTIAVQGHYQTSPSMTGGLEQTMTVVDFLVQRYRKA